MRIKKWINQRKIFYENVIPTINKTVNVNFKDNSDLIFEEQKNKKIQFARKLNNFFFFSFNISYFIMISLYKTYFDKDPKKSFNRTNSLIDRGRILDRNGEIIATNINTKDLYIDTRKVLNNYDLKSSEKYFLKKTIFSLIKYLIKNTTSE